MARRLGASSGGAPAWFYRRARRVVALPPAEQSRCPPPSSSSASSGVVDGAEGAEQRDEGKEEEGDATEVVAGGGGGGGSEGAGGGDGPRGKGGGGLSVCLDFYLSPPPPVDAEAVAEKAVADAALKAAAEAEEAADEQKAAWAEKEKELATAREAAAALAATPVRVTLFSCDQAAVALQLKRPVLPGAAAPPAAAAGEWGGAEGKEAAAAEAEAEAEAAVEVVVTLIGVGNVVDLTFPAGDAFAAAPLAADAGNSPTEKGGNDNNEEGGGAFGAWHSFALVLSDAGNSAVPGGREDVAVRCYLNGQALGGGDAGGLASSAAALLAAELEKEEAAQEAQQGGAAANAKSPTAASFRVDPPLHALASGASPLELAEVLGGDLPHGGGVASLIVYGRPLGILEASRCSGAFKDFRSVEAAEAAREASAEAAYMAQWAVDHPPPTAEELAARAEAEAAEAAAAAEAEASKKGKKGSKKKGGALRRGGGGGGTEADAAGNAAWLEPRGGAHLAHRARPSSLPRPLPSAGHAARRLHPHRLGLQLYCGGGGGYGQA